jgi:hypothetical protein
MFDFGACVRSVFEYTGPRNPLRSLNPEDKAVLVSLLTVYLAASVQGDDGFEQVAATARQASVLATKIHQSRGTYLVQALRDVLGDVEELAMRLVGFSIRFGWLRDRFLGKQGQQGKLSKNEFLLMASEFIRYKTKRYNDEHLAELIQALKDKSDVSDFSGDAIHKKRQYLKRAYPLRYACLYNKVREFRTERVQSQFHIE